MGITQHSQQMQIHHYQCANNNEEIDGTTSIYPMLSAVTKIMSNIRFTIAIIVIITINIIFIIAVMLQIATIQTVMLRLNILMHQSLSPIWRAQSVLDAVPNPFEDCCRWYCLSALSSLDMTV